MTTRRIEKAGIHGDVIITNVKLLGKEIDLSQMEKINSNVLAEGEVTGHLHALGVTHQTVRKFTEKELASRPGFQLYKAANGDLYVQVEVDTPLSHQEHNTVMLAGGETYKVGIARQVNPFTQAIERVTD